MQEVPEELEFQRHYLGNEVVLEEAGEESVAQRTSHALETVKRLVSGGSFQVTRRASAPPSVTA